MTPQTAFWNKDAAYWLKELNSTPQGLNAEEATKRLAAMGPGKRKQPAFIKNLLLFINQFTSPLVLLLVAAVILSAFLGETSDVIIISSILLATGTLSFYQEMKAGNVVEQLQSMIEHKVSVIREGKQVEIASKDIVAGDILTVNAGDMIPADCIVIESNELHCNESSLTGESYPVRKQEGIVDVSAPLSKRTNCLWSGSNIVSGTGKALVIETGENTVFGSIAKSAKTTTETAFEKGIKHFGFFLMQTTIVLAITILVINLLFHRPLMDSVLFALALSIGMAPELLPAISTIAMSAGARRMLQQKVIVKKLSSIQNLGEVNLFCSDKTGTITEGAIKVAGTYDASGTASPFVQELAAINATYESGYANPIDEALKQFKLDPAKKIEKIGEVPYDFLRKMLSVAVNKDGEKIIITKGALKQILTVCTSVRINEKEEPIAPHADEIQKHFVEYSENGFRVIGLCYKKTDAQTISNADEKEMVFGGFILLQDPLKAGLQDAIKALADMKVGLKIITGDNKIIAQSIGKQIGILNPIVISGDELDAMTSEALIMKAAEAHIFAEVEPRQKERIIQALRKKYTVAYMGDGINDVAAIHAADVGISIDNAVDTAKEAADFVLLEPNLMVLAEGIKEGRKTFSNTLKYILIATGTTFGNMFSVAGASLLLPFLPMLPKQILLTNFLTDFPFLAVATDNVDEEQLQSPRHWELPLIRKYMVVFGVHSSLFDLITFLTLLYFFKAKEGVFQTAWFIESVLTGLLIIFIVRTRKSFIKSKPGKYLIALTIGAFVIALTIPYWPFASYFGMSKLTAPVLLSMLGIVLLYIITADILKIWFFKRIVKNQM